jgi:hypothetical protein
MYTNTLPFTTVSTGLNDQPSANDNSDDFGGNPPSSPSSITYRAAAGGRTTEDGFENTGYAEVIHDLVSGQTAVYSGVQQLQSGISRNFQAKGPGRLIVSAELAGDIAWRNSGNWDFSLPPGDNPLDPTIPYHDYNLVGIVTLSRLVDNQPGASAVDTIILNNDTRSGSFDFVPELDPNVYYVLNTLFAIETRIENFDALFFEFTGDLPDVLRLGFDDNPLLLTTNIAAVPIPSSLILLVSGLGWLVIRRKTAKS